MKYITLDFKSQELNGASISNIYNIINEDAENTIFVLHNFKFNGVLQPDTSVKFILEDNVYTTTLALQNSTISVDNSNIFNAKSVITVVSMDYQDNTLYLKDGGEANLGVVETLVLVKPSTDNYHCFITFTSGDVAPTIVAEGITFNKDFASKANKTYEIDILNNRAVWSGFDA